MVVVVVVIVVVFALQGQDSILRSFHHPFLHPFLRSFGQLRGDGVRERCDS